MDSLDQSHDENLTDVTSLWHRYLAHKTIDLRNQLAEHYLPLVKLVAGRLAISLPAHVDRDDLLSSGFLACWMLSTGTIWSGKTNLKHMPECASAERCSTICVPRIGFP